MTETTTEQTIPQDLEERIEREQWTRAPRTTHDQRFASRYVPDMPSNFIGEVIGLDNYREHTLGKEQELADSIEQKGLFEPILLGYHTQTNQWQFIDGEGRFWACLSLGEQDAPVELPAIIYYDLSKADVLRLKLTANAAKTPIDAEDMATFTEKLYRLMVDYYENEFEEKNGTPPPQFTSRNLADLIGRTPSTTRDYLTFTRGLHADLVDYALSHREERLYGRMVALARALPNKHHQRSFFYTIYKAQERKTQENVEALKRDYARKASHKEREAGTLRKRAKTDQKNAETLRKKANKLMREAHKLRHPRLKVEGLYTRMPDKEFRQRLTQYADSVKKQDLLRQEQQQEKNGNAKLRELFRLTRDALHYAEALCACVEHVPELKAQLSTYRFEPNVRLARLVQEFVYSHGLLEASLEERVLRKRDRILHSETTSFRDKMYGTVLKKQKKKGKNGITQIQAIGRDIVYIPVDHIRMTKSQPRSTYTRESIDKLVEDIDAFGQLKPGLVRKTSKVEGKQRYVLVFGQSRYQAVKILSCKQENPIRYYKAFVLPDDISKTEIAILQAMEDLSESDKPTERAEGLWKYYALLQEDYAAKGEPFTEDDFKNRFQHWASPRVLEQVFHYKKASPFLQKMAKSRLVSYSSVAKIGSSGLGHDAQVELAYGIMADRQDFSLEDAIQRKRAEQNQSSFFEEQPRSFEYMIDTFRNKVTAAFQGIRHVADLDTSVQKKVMNNPTLFARLAQVVERVEQVKTEVYEKKSSCLRCPK